MKNDKNIFLIIKLILVLLLIISFSGMSGCGQTKETKQSQITETYKNEKNRLTQIKPLNTEVIQDKSVLYKCDLQRTGVFEGENPKLKGEVLWNLEIKEKFSEKGMGIEPRSSPIIFEDFLYIGNIDHNMYVIDVNTGKLNWSFKTGGPIISSAALWNRILYFGSEDGFFYAVNIDTHKLRWKYRTDGPIYSSPAIAEKMVFFGSTDGTFYALDALTGEEKWKFDTKQSISCNPAIHNNRIYFVSNPEERAGSSKEDNLPKILALDLITGAKIWCLEVDKKSHLDNFCIKGNYMFVGFYSLLLASHRADCQGIVAVHTGSETETSPPKATFLWFFPSLSSGSIVEPSCNADTLCFSAGNVYAVNIGDTRKIGERYQDYISIYEYMWEYKVRSHSRGESVLDQANAPPAFSGDGNVVYFGDNHGYLHAVETDTGKEILLYKPPLLIPYSDILSEFRSITSFPVLYKGKVYIYLCGGYTEYENRNEKQFGVLYCIQ